MSNPTPSLRGAINAKCRDCVYDPLSGGTWRAQVARCSELNCPLWAVRPQPESGPYAKQPTDPAGVTPAWLAMPLGRARTGHPIGTEVKSAAGVRS